MVTTKTNAYLLCGTGGGQSRVKPICRGGGQTGVLPPQPERGAEKAALACLDPELLRNEAPARRDDLAAASLLACSRLPPGTVPTPPVIWHHLLFLMHGHNPCIGQMVSKKAEGILVILKTVMWLIKKITIM